MKRTLSILFFYIMLIEFAFAHGGLTKECFLNPPTESHIHTWWHWMDGYITEEGIKKDLESMKQQGINSVTILNAHFNMLSMDIPVVKFGTKEWYDKFKYALCEAERLGISVGTANCDGWSESGGPWIDEDNSMKNFTWRKTFVKGNGKSQVIKLAKPIGNKSFYRDAYVVAYKSTEVNSFVKSNPFIEFDGLGDKETLIDGNPGTGVKLKGNNTINISFEKAFIADELYIYLYNHLVRAKLPISLSLEASDDNKKFRLVSNMLVEKENELLRFSIGRTKAKYYRVTVNDSKQEIIVNEVFLLRKGEVGLFHNNISDYSVKVCHDRTRKMEYFWSKDNNVKSDCFIKSSKDVINISDKLDKNGNICWTVPHGDWTIIRFGYTTTGQTNHPASPEGVGYECDKMDTTALNIHFRNYPQKLIELAGDLKGKTFKYFLIDSWEAGMQNWTKNFVEEFKKRRGYDMIPFIPVLCGEIINDSEHTEAFLHDFRKTIGDLILNYYFKHFYELCKRYGMKLYSEGIYGDRLTPPIDILKTYQYCDVPMTEFWARLKAHKWPFRYTPQNYSGFSLPANGSFLYGKSVTAAEAYTGYAVYSDSPYDLKLYSDQAFVNGVNNLVLHSYVHQPIEKKPGFTLDIYGQSFNRHNTWFNYADSFFDYLARCQYVLQNGLPVADAMVYIGDKLPSIEMETKEIEKLLPNNMRFNYCNSEVLQERLSVKNGLIYLDGKYEFQFLVVKDKYLNIETMRKIEELVLAGAVVFMEKPFGTLSLYEFDANNKELIDIAERIWNTGCEIIKYGKGKILTSSSVLKSVYRPDVKMENINRILYSHKSIDGKDVYFIVNKDNDKGLDAKISFRTIGKIPYLWDPMDGSVNKLVSYHVDKEYTNISLYLRAKQAVFIVFDKNDEVERADQNISTLSIDTFCVSKINGYVLLDNEQYDDTIKIDSFKHLTDYVNPMIKYYSGVAKYEFEVDLPQDIVDSENVSINWGYFGSTASVEINGKNVGTVWDPNYNLDITDYINKGLNKFVVIVTNPWRNRLIGDKIESRGDNNAWTTSKLIDKYDPIPIISKDAELIPSGIGNNVYIYSKKKNSVSEK